MWALFGWSCLVVFPLLVGCEQTTSKRVQSQPKTQAASLLEPAQLNAALAAVFADLPKPIRVLRVRATPSYVSAQVQNAQVRTQVDEYRYTTQSGRTGPVQVRLLGKGKLRDNLFPLNAIDLRRSTRVISGVQEQYGLPIRKLVITRNLPRSMDIQFRAHLGSREDELVVAASKRGRILGPVESVPAPSP